MVQQEFGDLLKIFREMRQPKCSQKELADYIGKTKQYISLLENQHDVSIPPTFEICQKLVKCLKLTPEQEYKLLSIAFQKRIHNNYDFYEYISQKNRQNLSPSHPQPSAETKGLCRYYVQALTLKNRPFLTAEMDQILHRIFSEIVHELNGQFNLETVQSSALQFILDLPPKHAPLTIVKQLLNLASAELKNQFSEFSDFGSSLWASDIYIGTSSFISQGAQTPAKQNLQPSAR